ncbi:MAG: bifunctional folylpolyglutamate synthase/dihydrofolate synthase [Robiginitomaculum sp.]|nr:bifunctional folylpolyglutamate synthase/dihydrofolate synthase [Robiginitomaculum sp.]
MNARVRVDAALARFEDLHNQSIDLDLSRILVLLVRLGNPHLNLPPVIHVAGSNGKGSSIAFLSAMALAEGLRVHVHTSPHLIRINERFVLNGVPISDVELADLLEEVETINADNPATQFELLTATMFLAFSRTPADVAIIEVGLGGELDATNVIPAPALSVITPITLEHMDWLGSDIAGIAAAKAGIIKPNCPVISAAQSDVVRDVIERTAAKNRSSLRICGEDFYGREEDGRLVWQSENQLLDLPLPVLAGAHQIENACLAIAAATELGWSVNAISTGLQSVNWPGRLQRIPAFSPCPPDTEIWLDGAHNPHAAHALAQFLMERNRQYPADLHLIFAMQNTKDVSGFLAPLHALTPVIHIVPLPSASAPIQCDVLAKKALEIGLQAVCHSSLSEALAAIPTGKVRLVVTGSLYLVGDILQMQPA